MSHKFIASWDCLGLEFLMNVTEHEQKIIVATLKGEKYEVRNPLQHLILRAQFNPQRNYEIYAFNSDVDEVSIREAFHDNPQHMADTIRGIGEKLYSDRDLSRRVIV